MQNAELYLKGVGYLWLGARLAELASKLERVDCSHWFYSGYGREYQSKLSTDLSLGER